MDKESLSDVIKLLEHRKKLRLAKLLQRSWLELDESRQYGTYLFSTLTTARVHSPVDEYEVLKNLAVSDRNEILQTLLELYPPGERTIEINELQFVVDTSLGGSVREELIQLIEEQRNLMIGVATGGERIDVVNDAYRSRRQQIAEKLKSLRIEDPNPFGDLWAWYKRWKTGDLPTYRSRREFVSGMYDLLLDQLKLGDSSNQSRIFDELTGWPRVDRVVAEIRDRLQQARSEEQFQAVGLLCREALISLAQTVFDSTRHEIVDGTEASPADAKRMLEAYLAAELGGNANKVARQHARAALDLANEVQHKRTASFRNAALCAEATASVISLIAIISGRRDP